MGVEDALRREQKHNQVLAEAIEEGLTIICDSAACSVLYFLKNNGSIRSESNIESLEKFSEGLRSIFGCGSRVIEKQIIKALYTRLRLPSAQVPERFEFSKEVRRAFRHHRASQLVGTERIVREDGV
ncbi:MAG: hypothetical protein OEY30_03615 [Candidatus Bathyarchaeota archaeon]|nr:hypothetical protein [Candidatus Bathyarchaeota archaeon]